MEACGEREVKEIPTLTLKGDLRKTAVHQAGKATVQWPRKNSLMRRNSYTLMLVERNVDNLWRAGTALVIST